MCREGSSFPPQLRKTIIIETRESRIHDKRGNSKNRRVRKEWLLTTFGDGTTCVCSFEDCETELTYETLTVDRWPISGYDGGRYIRGNIRPSCGPCNFSDGAKSAHQRRLSKAE